MAIKVFDTLGASVEEINGIKEILNSNNIQFDEVVPDYYGGETSGGGIWILNSNDVKLASNLIKQYEHEFSIRNKYDVAKEVGYSSETPIHKKILITVKYIIRTKMHTFSFKILTVLTVFILISIVLIGSKHI